MVLPRLLWDLGTAYDLFASLKALHHPTEYGIRGSWAAGVRARLTAATREMLQQTQRVMHKEPLHWVYTLPEPKDGAAVLWALSQTPPAERICTLGLSPDLPTDITDLLRNVAARGAWSEQDQETFRASYRRECEKAGEKTSFSLKELANILDWWSRPKEFGEHALEALHTYQEVFFAEEEKRIYPALQTALARAQELAGRLELPDLLEELSQGLRFDEPPQVAEVIMVPSYWNTPLVHFAWINANRELWTFGARPADASLVPGETVPDSLVQTLKALSEPTRLRILRYLTEEHLAPAQLARRLRLRTSTVMHHLKALRLAGLVQLTIGMGPGKETKYYAARTEAVEAAFSTLKGFLEEGGTEGSGD